VRIIVGYRGGVCATIYLLFTVLPHDDVGDCIGRQIALVTHKLHLNLAVQYCSFARQVAEMTGRKACIEACHSLVCSTGGRDDIALGLH
jgi:hypothetical protein